MLLALLFGLAWGAEPSVAVACRAERVEARLLLPEGAVPRAARWLAQRRELAQGLEARCPAILAAQAWMDLAFATEALAPIAARDASRGPHLLAAGTLEAEQSAARARALLEPLAAGLDPRKSSAQDYTPYWMLVRLDAWALRRAAPPRTPPPEALALLGPPPAARPLDGAAASAEAARWRDVTAGLLRLALDAEPADRAAVLLAVSEAAERAISADDLARELLGRTDQSAFSPESHRCLCVLIWVQGELEGGGFGPLPACKGGW